MSIQGKDEDISDEGELTVFIQPPGSELYIKRERRIGKCNWKVLLMFLVLVLVVSVFFAAGFLVGHYTLRNTNINTSNNNNDNNSDKCSSICSNPPVLLISLDGFRADYLDRGVTPTIKSFASDGVRADYMTPAFPSLTFPNHFTIVTGLHPESHGIISNSFFSREFNESFYIGSKTSNDPKWWLGEPIWVTGVKGTLKTAVYFWPGSEVPIQGILPTTYFKYDGSVPFTKRMKTVLSWIERPDATRPQFMAAYISEPDHTAHQYGPNTTMVDDALKQVDSSVSVLINGLKDKNLYDCVDIIIVSDHG